LYPQEFTPLNIPPEIEPEPELQTTGKKLSQLLKSPDPLVRNRAEEIAVEFMRIEAFLNNPSKNK